MLASARSAPFSPDPHVDRQANRLALRSAATHLLHRVMHDLDLAPWDPPLGKYGNPLPKSGWYVSKSHCGSMVAAAVAQGPVGIDVEPIQLSRVARWDRVIDDAERALLGPVDDLLFTRLWTAKEAILKADGIGIGGLSRCRLKAVLDPNCLELSFNGVLRRVEQQISTNHVVSIYAEGCQSVSFASES